MTEELQGKKALVTGGSRGIGRATALALANAGCDVVVSYIHSAKEAEETVVEVTKYDRRGYSFQVDLSLPTGAKQLVDYAEEHLGRIDVLVNNAGINPSYSLDDINLPEWDRTIATNLTSTFLVTQAALIGMRKRQWGRIIMLSSVASQTGGVIGPHYAASKAGMIGLMHSYANLLAKEGITANAIAPALIETDMIRGNDKIKPSLIPIGRFGHIDEVARAVIFLAANGYITGQTINVNGGWYMSS